MIAGFKWYHKTIGVKPHTADFYTGKDEIDREEAAFLAHQAATKGNKKDGNWFYRTFISWLF
jgi:amino acid transporter